MTDVLGTKAELVAVADTLWITKRDAQKVIQNKLDVTDRHARASISSYQTEHWGLQQARINEPLCAVNSFMSRVMTQANARHDASVTNGKLGGRGKSLLPNTVI